jgi:ferritin-like metal-binding protein YciE
MESLSEPLEEELKDLYSAESQILKALPKMVKKASSTSQAKAARSPAIVR